jgi:hypothetical protein
MMSLIIETCLLRKAELNKIGRNTIMRKILPINDIKIFLLVLFALIVMSPQLSLAQEEDVQLDYKDQQNGAPYVYLDIGGWNNPGQYLRTEIPFVTYVRDPQLAEIHILIVSQQTGSGGRRFDISFIGRGKYTGRDQTLFYISPQSDSQDEEREGLARVIKMGLMPYVSETLIANQIDITFDEEQVTEVQETFEDSWDYWIFSINIGGGMRAEESNKSFDLSGGLSANRITEEWKIQNRFDYRYEEEKFKDDDETIKSILKRWNASSRIVKSLSSNWSTGFFANVSSTTYRNIKLSWSVAPALEYNFFPWSESQRRQFSIAYRVGYLSQQYYEITLFDRLSDNLFYHALDLSLEMIQPWGRLNFRVDASQYVELKDSYSVTFDLEADFRITNGLEFFFDTRIQSIHDQLYLPKGDATLDEILLKRRQIATSYYLWFRVGFRFTFGSIYNNVVNERL